MVQAAWPRERGWIDTEKGMLGRRVLTPDASRAAGPLRLAVPANGGGHALSCPCSRTAGTGPATAESAPCRRD